MAAHRITLIPGDGIGPEVTDVAVWLLDRSGVDIEWDRQDAGARALERCGTPLPQAVLDSVTRNGVALKGPAPLNGSRVLRSRTRGAKGAGA